MLVGGFGTRLRPLTSTTPKPMLPVGHRPIIEHVVHHLAAHGVDEVVLSLGFAPEVFIDAYPDDECLGVRLVYAVEPEPLDTAGAIGFAARHAGIDDTFVVVNGDVLSDVDITELVRFHRERGAEGTIHLHAVDDPSAFGVVTVDGRGKVEAFIEKPPRDEAPANTINGGTYVLEPSVLGRIATDRKVSIEREVFPAMVADGTLYAIELDGYWLDTGRPDQYIDANLDALDQLRANPLPCAPAAPGSVVAGLVRHSVIGAGAIVAPDAQVADSVVLDGATIEAGARVVRSAIGPGAVVGAGASLVDCVLGADAIVEAGVVLEAARVPDPTA